MSASIILERIKASQWYKDVVKAEYARLDARMQELMKNKSEAEYPQCERCGKRVSNWATILCYACYIANDKNLYPNAREGHGQKWLEKRRKKMIKDVKKSRKAK